jgi:hypothetical protein
MMMRYWDKVNDEWVFDSPGTSRNPTKRKGRSLKEGQQAATPKRRRKSVPHEQEVSAQRYWDKANDEWIHEVAIRTEEKRGEESPAPENLVLVLQALHREKEPVPDECLS